MRLRNVWVSALGVMIAASVAACGGGGGTSSNAVPAPAPGAAAIDKATVGEITGTVVLDGAAPKNEPIRMSAEPYCQKANTTPQFQETYVVGGDGKSLANVFVYVKDGLGNYIYDAPSGPATIDQKNCRYHPHVFGMRVGQTLEILNSD